MNKFQKIRTKLSGSEIFKNILTLFTGTALAQAIPLLLAPIISRIYSEQDFALLADYVSIFGLISVLSTGRYSFAIVVAKDNRKAAAVTLLAMSISVFVSILTLLIVVLFRDSIAGLLKNSDLSVWLLFLPLSVLFFGLFETFSYYLNRSKYYKQLSAAKMSRSGSTGLFNILVGKLGFRQAGLVIGLLIGDMFAAIVSGFKVIIKGKLFRQKISAKEIKTAAYEHRNFPLFNSLQAFSDKIRESGVILIISAFFSDEITGAYFFGFKYVRAPLILLVYVLFQIFYRKFSEKKNAGEVLFPLLKKLITYGVPISVFAFLILFFGGEFLFEFVFGAKWRTAGYYVSLLAPFVAINFISGTISFIPMVLDKQKQFFLVALVYNISVPLAVLLVSVYINDIVYLVNMQALIASVSLLWIIVWIIMIVRKYDNSVC